jgi:hypothetical protein
MLTSHPLLVPSSRKSRSYTSSHPNAPLWSVTGPLFSFLYADFTSCFVRRGTCSLTLKEELGLKVFENRILRRINYTDIRDRIE